VGIRDALRRRGFERWFFTLAYRRHRTPWDTGVTPPELVRVVEGPGPDRLPAGRALDLGCGTGTNALYLARHGWDVVGIDFAGPAIVRARSKAARAGATAGSVRFLRGDVTHLAELDLRGPYDLVFDLGCFHGVAPEGRVRYAREIARLSRPGALLLLYAIRPGKVGGRVIGLTVEDVRAVFVPQWRLERVEPGKNPNGREAAWYWMRREAPGADVPS
jgi:SAM-dependent methyltransferase